MTAVRTLVALVPDWPVVAAGATPDQPAAVFHANRVVAATAAARADGVETGLRRREAQGRCPALAILDHDPARDARAFEPVVASLADVCPRIEVAAPGRLAFPTRGPSRYFGGDDALAALVADRTGALVGIADGPFAARLAAVDSLVIPPLASPAFLAPRPLDELLVAGFDPDLVDVFRRLGLRSLGALAALPAADVVARFGPDGLAAHRLASGRDEWPPATTPPPADLVVRAELDPPAERVETAAFVARGLADELVGGLDARGLACTRLVVVAETEHGERLERCWRGEGAGGAAALSAGAVADRVRWQLDGWLHGTAATRPTAGIALIELVPDEVLPAGGRQLGFWGGGTGAGEAAVRALGRLAGLLGPDAVTVPEWRGGRGPGDEVGTVPAAAVALDERRVAPVDERPWPGRIPTPAPAAVAPVEAELLDADDRPVAVGGRGLLVSGPPSRLRVGAGGTWAGITAWAGPWPVEERWWDARRARRRARLQVLDDAGVAHLLALEGGRWWVEATYD